jgi:hypothetical protein
MDATPAATGTLGPTSRGRIENFTLVGHQAMGGRGWNGGIALDYPCAYVGSRRLPAIAIVDVGDPSQPVLTGDMALAPGIQPVELRAVPDLGLLVVLSYSPVLSLLTFDIHDCRQPRPLGSLALGAAPHEFYLWRDPAQPARLLAYMAMFGHSPDLNVVDLSDPARPSLVGQWSAATDGAAGTLHSLSLTPDGGRAFLAMWTGGFRVADTSDFASGRPQPKLRLLGAAALLPPPGHDVHSAVVLADPRYVLLTQEVYACPFGGVTVADISDPARPQSVSTFALPENDPGCAALPEVDAVFTAHNPLVVGPLAFITWYGGGLQALDLSDPARPVRIGLFVPEGGGPVGGSPYGRYPVQLWSYPILRAGLIYVSDIETGLYVLRYTGPGAEAMKAGSMAEGNASAGR